MTLQSTAPMFREDAIVLRRRAGFQAGMTGVRISSDVLSLVQDLLFALTTVAAMSGLRLPVGHLPIFIVFTLFVLVANVRMLSNMRVSGKAFVLPLFVFMIIHLTSAFSVSFPNGVIFVFQALCVSLFVWTFVIRYSQVPMRRYLHVTGICIVALMTWVIGYHLAHHKISSWKMLNDPKVVFDFLPIMLLVLKRSNAPLSKKIFPYAFFLFTVFVLLSGERKAYILLALLSPLMVSFRSPFIYLGILAVAVAVPAVSHFEKSGYVARQLNTLSGFSQGKIERTNSNTERALALTIAGKLLHHHQLFGVGTNAYTKYANYYERGALGPHNEWVRVTTENGIIGLLFYQSTVVYGFIGLFRRRVWGRVRGFTEFLMGLALFATLLMYISFETYQFLTLLAFCFLPFVQYLRLDPNDGERLPSKPSRRFTLARRLV